MIILITGKPGVGKTTLGREFMSNFAGSRIIVEDKKFVQFHKFFYNVMVDCIESDESLHKYLYLHNKPKNLILICQHKPKFKLDRRIITYLKLK